MKNIKTYEEFNWGDIVHIISNPLAIGLLSYTITKLGSKYFLKKHDKKWYNKIINGFHGLYTNNKWKVEENDNIIKLTREREKYDTEYPKSDFIIDKTKRTIEYTGTNTKIKLKERELNYILEGVEFVKTISASIKDFFYDLSDNGFKCYLYSIDFYKKSFCIKIVKNNVNESTINEGEIYDDDEYDENGDLIWDNNYDHYDDPHRFHLKDIGADLDELLYRVTSTYGLKINNDPSYIPPIENGYVKVTEYKEGHIKLSNGDYYDSESKEIRYVHGVIDSLMVPLIKI